MNQATSSQQNFVGLGESTASGDNKFSFTRFEGILLGTCACTLLGHKLFLLSLSIQRLLQLGTIIWLPSIFILDILVFAIVLLFLKPPKRWHLRTKAAAFTSKAFATLFALFVIIITCASMVLMIETGHELKWKLAFEVEWKSTKSLIIPQIPLFSTILIIQPVLGALLSCVLRFWLERKRDTYFARYYLPLFKLSTRTVVRSRIASPRSTPVIKWMNRWKWGLFSTIYVLLVLTIRPLRPWKQLSNNPTGDLAWTIFHPPHNRKNQPPPYWDQNFVNFVTEQMSAPEVDLSKAPRAILKHPIRNVVIINLESVRADVLPLSPKFVETIGSEMVDKSLTSQDITPFWNSLRPNSLIMSDTSATSSYTLKSLLSTFCGMYPLNVNFMEESRQDRHFYQQCLPQLVREAFVTPKEHSSSRRWWSPQSLSMQNSRFRSAFFQTSEDTFDHQGEEFNKMGWDRTFYTPDVRRFSPEAKKMGWFGVGDNDLLPLFWHWVDSTLGDKKQLLAGILTTSTHFPFELPEGEEYRNYVTNDIVNKYLNSIRLTDMLLRDIMEGFKERGVLNETMFVILGDHGHGFDDWNHSVLGALDNPMENGFRVPFMVYSPALEPAGPIEGKYTNLDVLPTIMDALISSSQHTTWDEEYSPIPLDIQEELSREPPDDSAEARTRSHHTESDTSIMKRSEDNLLELTVNMNRRHVQQILHRYEGTSIFRQFQDPNNPQRMTFHIDNPGNAHIILVQYPMKIVHDAIGEITYLYDLSHDEGEWNDLLSLPISRGKTTPPPWVEWREETLLRDFHLKWWIEATDEVDHPGILPDRDSSIEYVKPENGAEIEGEDDGKLNLDEAFDWAEDAFEILLGWSWITKERYLTGKLKVDIRRNTILEDYEKDEYGSDF